MSRLVVLDTETGGLDPERFSLLSVGVVVWETDELGAADEFFVAEPEIRCEPEAMAVNAIDTEVLAQVGLPPEQAVIRLEHFLDTQFPVAVHDRVTVAGHNVHFDVAFIRRLYRLAGRTNGPRFSHRVLDTAGILQFLILVGHLPAAVSSSSDAFRHFGIEVAPGKRHSALADARATAQLLTKLVTLARRRP